MVQYYRAQYLVAVAQESLSAETSQEGDKSTQDLKFLKGFLLAFVAFSTMHLAIQGISIHSIMYLFSYAKMTVTLVKYIPQLFLNFQRKATTGWAFSVVLMDLTGGLFSLGQMMLDSSLLVIIEGNPVKLGLALVSIFFDFGFIIQQNCLGYQIMEEVVSISGRSASQLNPSETTPLLAIDIP